MSPDGVNGVFSAPLSDQQGRARRTASGLNLEGVCATIESHQIVGGEIAIGHRRAALIRRLADDPAHLRHVDVVFLGVFGIAGEQSQYLVILY